MTAKCKFPPILVSPLNLHLCSAFNSKCAETTPTQQLGAARTGLFPCLGGIWGGTAGQADNEKLPGGHQSSPRVRREEKGRGVSAPVPQSHGQRLPLRDAGRPGLGVPGHGGGGGGRGPLKGRFLLGRGNFLVWALWVGGERLPHPLQVSAGSLAAKGRKQPFPAPPAGSAGSRGRDPQRGCPFYEAPRAWGPGSPLLGTQAGSGTGECQIYPTGAVWRPHRGVAAGAPGRRGPPTGAGILRGRGH